MRLSLPLLRLSPVLCATCAFIVSSGSASAGFLAPIWTGVYIGAHGGVNWADLDTDVSSTLSSSSFQGGGHLGYNIGIGGIVLGVEGDANFSDTSFGYSTRDGGTQSLDVDWNGTIRARAGVTFGPALIYATVGYAYESAAITGKTATGSSFSLDQAFHGVVYGGGVESYVFPNLSLRLEALQYDYGSDKLSVSGAAAAVQDFDPSDTVVRAGITFHLN